MYRTTDEPSHTFFFIIIIEHPMSMYMYNTKEDDIVFFIMLYLLSHKINLICYNLNF